MSDHNPAPAAERAELDRLIECGGPAFPVAPLALPGRDVFSHPGQSLRDDLAKAAMQALLTWAEYLPEAGNLDRLAADAYRVADAMLSERKKQ